jgi:transaldolase/glucose-6-phosphate isomerase
MNAEHDSLLQALRVTVRDHKHVAACLGFGPRFLHSTRQDYKGGPNSGVFLPITCDDCEDLPVPGQKYTFGVVKALAGRKRRALRNHLGSDVKAGLGELAELIKQVV